jgi:hypothetical protein
MNQLRLTKRRVLSAAAFLAILGLALSVFAETAGGVNLQADNTGSGQSMTSYKGAGQVFQGNVDLNTAGTGAAIAAANFTTNPSPTTDATTTTAPTQQIPASTSLNNSDNDATPPPVAVTPLATPIRCACPRETEHDVMIACPDYCVAPTPTPIPGCPTCGPYQRLESSSVHMCPMIACME